MPAATAQSERNIAPPLTPHDEYNSFIGEHADKYIMETYHRNGNRKYTIKGPLEDIEEAPKGD